MSAIDLIRLERLKRIAQGLPPLPCFRKEWGLWIR